MPNVLRVAASDDDGGAAVHHAVPDLPRCVVRAVARRQHLAPNSGGEGFDIGRVQASGGLIQSRVTDVFHFEASNETHASEEA
jgi:hypothetical protein